MALSQNTYVHMETVEVTPNENEKPCETGGSRTLRCYHSVQSQEILVYQ